jgi:hypothetical protein
LAPTDTDRVNAPTFAGANGIARHPPTQPTLNNQERQSHDRRDETLRVAAPSLTASDRTSPIRADGAIVTTKQKASTSVEDVVIRLSLVNADLQYGAVKAEIRVCVRRFQIEVVAEG